MRLWSMRLKLLVIIGGSRFVVLEGVIGVHIGAIVDEWGIPFPRIGGCIGFKILLERSNFPFPWLVGYGCDRFTGRSAATFGITVSDRRKNG